MELIWESKDTRTAIWRRWDCYWLEHDHRFVCPSTTYYFACWYAETEILEKGETEDRPFPQLV